MLLAVDIGNTSINLGIYENGKLVSASKLLTDRETDSDTYADAIKELFTSLGIESPGFETAVISSVVPEITDRFSSALSAFIKTIPLIVGEKYNGNLKVDILPVSHLGADLIAASIGAIKKYPLPCLVADLGTATKILVIDKNGVFRGCTISPGVKISLDALSEKTSLLPEIILEKPEHAIGENTVECMQSGIVFGTAAMLDGLIRRISTELGEENITLIATGGYSETISQCCEHEMIYDEHLLLDGLAEIYETSRIN